MDTPWLKSLIFWAIVITVIFAVFQCSQKTENNKQASALMYERLYQCTRDLKTEHKALLTSIQQRLTENLNQQDMVKLINECRKVNPSKPREYYIQAIKSSN